jgi:selenocysteine-specific elongation factor
MIVGTAGHVDHGKTALLRALTGVDTDRLAEEKRRGISIDLGFAYLPTPDGDVIGFVDVPGHEHFLHNMLAGAGGIDFALMAVAADDGIMPQTREHLAIVDLLGITRGIVALCKIDLATPDRRAAVMRDISRMLQGTGLADAEIVEVSAASGAGTDDLRARLFAEAARLPPRDATGLFRLVVDRCFTLKGAGTIVTGIVLSGKVTVGDRVIVGPSGLAARVRSIHAQNRPATHGVAGQRCALNLAGDGITKGAISRGDAVLDPALDAPVTRIDARLRVLSTEAKPIATWLPVRLHHGAAELGARVVPLGEAAVAPGGEGVIQLVLDRAIAAVAGDRFILRDTTARRTIGGGVFLDLRAPARRRRTPERLAQLDALYRPDPVAALAALLDLPPRHVDLTGFLRDRALGADAGDVLAARLELVRIRVEDRVFAFTPWGWTMVRDAALAALADFHAAHPDAAGLAPERLRREPSLRLPAPLFTAIIAELARRSELIVENGLVRRPTHETRLTPVQRDLWARIEPLLIGDGRFQPPRLAELATTLGVAEGELRRFLKIVARLGLVEEVAPDHFFVADAIGDIVAMLPALASSAPEGRFTAAMLRDRLGGGRKAAIEILEHLDRRGVTVRRGDLRRLAQGRPVIRNRSG